MFSLTVEQIAKIVDGQIEGNKDIVIKKLQRIEDAGEGDLTFLARMEYEKYLVASSASAVIVPNNYKNSPKENQAFIRCEKPYEAFVSLIMHLENIRNTPKSFIHPTAVISEGAKIGENVQIGAFCVVSDGCSIGDNTVLMPNVVLYENVSIGKNTVIHSGVVCYQDVQIGNNCIIHSGAIIGADGFGFLENKETGEFTKIPQIGNVIIRDDVEIGANTTIDRALLGSTIIEKGVKIDNLVQVGHNCTIGENTGIAAQTGVSGSTKIGKRNRIGGQVGFAGHLETTDDVSLIAQSGVSKSVTKPGIYFGSPIKERMLAFKIEACLRQLPDLFAEFDKIKNELKNKQ
jgi:UDP-3-O-[3-hydroxymyristoyl] glucosamine N-acyltransferase